jgi:hypothetical protein
MILNGGQYMPTFQFNKLVRDNTAQWHLEDRDMSLL